MFIIENWKKFKFKRKKKYQLPLDSLPKERLPRLQQISFPIVFYNRLFSIVNKNIYSILQPELFTLYFKLNISTCHSKSFRTFLETLETFLITLCLTSHLMLDLLSCLWINFCLCFRHIFLRKDSLYWETILHVSLTFLPILYQLLFLAIFTRMSVQLTALEERDNRTEQVCWLTRIIKITHPSRAKVGQPLYEKTGIPQLWCKPPTASTCVHLHATLWGLGGPGVLAQTLSTCFLISHE